MSRASLGTWWRTVRQLHPLQLTARVPHRLVQAIVGATGVSVAAAPSVRELVLRSEVLDALTAFAVREARRYGERRAWLRGNPNLEAYEQRYGLDLPNLAFHEGLWTDRTSLSPYVASVRARRLASAIARGVTELTAHLVRAARAVAAAPEVHLLGNHLIENGVGLVCAAAVAEGREPDAWWALGSSILDWQLPQQFYADGMHDEGSMTYHLWLLAALIEAIALADAGGRAVPPHWVEVVERGLGIARDYEAPDGRYPLFNDAAYDAAPTIREVVALGSGCGFHVRRARAEPAFVSEVGWVVLRNARAWCVMKAGPDGSPTQPGHVHADLLSIELWVEGRKRISDPGVTSYNDDESRAWCRSSAAHNGPHFAGEDTSEVWSAFRTGRRAGARVIELRPGWCVAERHSAFGPVRRAVRLEPNQLTVEDGDSAHRAMNVALSCFW